MALGEKSSENAVINIGLVSLLFESDQKLAVGRTRTILTSIYLLKVNNRNTEEGVKYVQN